MTPEQWQRFKEIFQSAIERPPQERDAFLAEAYSADPSLKKEVDVMLASYSEAKTFIEEPVFPFAAELLAEEHSEGKRIGPYRIISEIGRGGMGAIYLAVRDDDQFRKRAAIKLIKRGMDTDDILRRFRNERQILAGLDHPNIAKLFDGGTTEDGLPYFILEYIEGKSINEYCDVNKLSTVERLKLFRTVCSAVHYAHQNLVVHRDLKPSNILITAEGLPKLLDFGIAKVLNPELSGQTIDPTRTAMRLMTPEYSSPEQVRGDTITTASDVYSLGVLLYELLSGHRPYHVASSAPQEIMRVVCEEEPDKPSTAVSRVEEVQSSDGKTRITLTPESVSGTRDGQPDKLRRLLSGDLDNIVLMAMRKEPRRRYASVEQFSEDIRRHLEGLPVVARKDTFSYRSTKFIGRHKAGVAAATLVFLILVTGIVVTVRQSRVTARQRDRAQLEQAKAERINDFLQEMLAFSDPSWNSPNTKQGHELTVREALDEAARRADGELADQPEVLAAVHRTVGNTYRGQGRFDLAEPHLRQALDLYRTTRGEDSSEAAVTMTELGWLVNLKGDYADAEDLLQRALLIYRKEVAAGDSVNWLGFVEDLGIIAGLRRLQGDLGAAEQFYREALSYSPRLAGKDRIMIATMNLNIGLVREDQGDLEGAEPLYRDAMREWRKLQGGEHVETAYCIQYLAINLKTRGQYRESEALFREAFDICKRLLGDNHVQTAQVQASFADLLYLKGEYEEAEKQVRGAIEIERRTLSEGSPYLAAAWTVLGKILTKTGRAAEAESYIRQALTIRTRMLRKGHWTIASTEGALAECLTAQKRYAEAESLLVESYNDLKASQGEQNPRTAEALHRLVELYDAWGKPEQAAHFASMIHRS